MADYWYKGKKVTKAEWTKRNSADKAKARSNTDADWAEVQARQRDTDTRSGGRTPTPRARRPLPQDKGYGTSPPPRTTNNRDYASQVRPPRDISTAFGGRHDLAGPHREPSAVEAPEDPMMALFEALLAAGGAGGGGGGAAPNLADYIAGISQGRDRVNQYQQAGSAGINQNTADLLAKMQQITGVQQADSAQRAAAQQAATQQVQGSQDQALLQSAQDLQGQGISSAPLEAQHTQLSGQLASSANDQAALQAKLAAMQAVTDSDRAKGAQQMGQGAQFTLQQNTQQQLGQLDAAEAEGRRAYAGDMNSYQASQRSASGGASDIERRFALAKEFAGLDVGTQQNPTINVRNQFPSQSAVFDLLEGGQSVNETRIGLRADIAREKKKAREDQDTDAIAVYEDALDALKAWEAATSPDAEVEAQNKQLETIRKYMGL